MIPFDLRFDIPRKMAMQIENKTVGDKLTAVVNYEVVEKDETGIKVAMDSMYFKTTKRVI